MMNLENAFLMKLVVRTNNSRGLQMYILSAIVRSWRELDTVESEGENDDQCWNGYLGTNLVQERCYH